MSDNAQMHQSGKLHFILKSTPPRTTFQQDMSYEERTIMGKHIAYWTEKQNQGIALVFGPVRNPTSPHGIAIIEVENEVPKLIAKDPAVIAGIMTTEYHPMLAVLPNRKS
ncbi:YciI family protein [Gottfriedia sp. OAE603]|uniref:YciI family protein n=1 Tax=Gottfriedia sp. OAE603 TaxID=2663872 RepID=UPI00178A31AD